MKQISVTITAEFEIPDEWEIVQHADEVEVLKIGSKYCDFSFHCMTTTSSKAGTTWRTDENVTGRLTDYLRYEKAEIKIASDKE